MRRAQHAASDAKGSPFSMWSESRQIGRCKIVCKKYRRAKRSGGGQCTRRWTGVGAGVLRPRGGADREKEREKERGYGGRGARSV